MRRAAVLLLLVAVACAQTDAETWCAEGRVAQCRACDGYLSPTSCQCKCKETPIQTLVYTYMIAFLLFVMFIV